MSSSEPEPLEIVCDAPPYPIVHSCHKLGFRSAEDVRWCHVSHLQPGPAATPARSELPAWKVLLGISESRPTKHCACHGALPYLDRYTFTLRSGGAVHYFLGQCGRCQTIYWREA